MPISSMIDPPLTTIRVMKEQMGEVAMQCLLDRIENGSFALNRPRIGTYRIVISTHLVERDSTAVPKQL